MLYFYSTTFMNDEFGYFSHLSEGVPFDVSTIVFVYSNIDKLEGVWIGGSHSYTGISLFDSETVCP